MRANSPSAFFISLTLHSVVAGLIIFLTYYSLWQQGPPPVIFELVAGPPTAPDELVAPALGNSATPVKLNVPVAKVELPEVKPEPQVEKIVKPVETSPASDVVPPPTKPKAKAADSLVKMMKKSEHHSEIRENNKWKKEQAAELKRAQQAALAKSRTDNVPRIDVEGIRQGVLGGSTANKRGGGGGKALTREEQTELNTYYSMIVAAVKDSYEFPPGVNAKLMATVTFDITASGHILNPRITKSSGNRAYDESVLDAFRRVRSIGPTPSGKSETDWSLPVRMTED